VNDEVDTDQQITESIPAVEPEPPVQETAVAPSPSFVEQLADPEHPEKALAAAFAGGLLFARLLRRVRS
jgi:hypothetical protein